MNELYDLRKLSEAHPNLARLAHDSFVDLVAARPDDTARVQRLFMYLGRLVNLAEPRNVLILGCGPKPQPFRTLIEMGHKAVGVEPVPSFVQSANQYVNGLGQVLAGSAEAIPLSDGSQHVVIFESVLEHVDSVPLSLREILRVLAPGGVLYLTTTNRLRLPFMGPREEFNVPFYNWFPRLLKECYVFDHLHYRPELANFTQRPAVHWLSFADLCAYGRDAGFAQFYSVTDLMRPNDPSILKSRARRMSLRLVQRNPWLRALALTQIGYIIFMVKRA